MSSEGEMRDTVIVIRTEGALTVKVPATGFSATVRFDRSMQPWADSVMPQGISEVELKAIVSDRMVRIPSPTGDTLVISKRA